MKNIILNVLQMSEVMSLNVEASGVMIYSGRNDARMEFVLYCVSNGYIESKEYISLMAL